MVDRLGETAFVMSFAIFGMVRSPVLGLILNGIFLPFPNSWVSTANIIVFKLSFTLFFLGNKYQRHDYVEVPLLDKIIMTDCQHELLNLKALQSLNKSNVSYYGVGRSVSNLGRVTCSSVVRKGSGPLYIYLD